MAQSQKRIFKLVQIIVVGYLITACQSEDASTKITITEMLNYDYECQFQAEHELFGENQFYIISDLNSKIPSAFGTRSILQEFEFTEKSTITTKDAVYIENTRTPSIIDSLIQIGAKKSDNFLVGKEITRQEDAFYNNSYTIRLDPENEIAVQILGKVNASTITFFKNKKLLKTVEIPDASAYSLRSIDLNNDGENELILYSAQMNSYMNLKVFQFCSGVDSAID